MAQDLQALLISVTFSVICLSVIRGDTNVRTTSFTRDITHDLTQTLTDGCAEKMPGTFRKNFDCSLACHYDCIGFLLNGAGSCYTFKQCADDVKYYLDTSAFFRKNNPCQHNSIWNVTTDTCKCVDGWVGERCERLPRYCLELAIYGYPTGWPVGSRWTDLAPDTYPTPIRARCDVWDTQANTMVMTNRGGYSFNRTWSEFVDGFTHDDFNFWLGLGKIKALSEAGSTLLYLNVYFRDETGKSGSFSRTYYGFHLDSDFKFNFSHAGTMSSHGDYANSVSYGDCLGPLVGAPFSTWDRDNDKDPSENCAALAGTGWWFDGCDMVCNPLGLTYTQASPIELRDHVKIIGIDYQSHTYTKYTDISMYITDFA